MCQKPPSRSSPEHWWRSVCEFLWFFLCCESACPSDNHTGEPRLGSVSSGDRTVLGTQSCHRVGPMSLLSWARLPRMRPPFFLPFLKDTSKTGEQCSPFLSGASGFEDGNLRGGSSCAKWRWGVPFPCWEGQQISYAKDLGY
jgi:hypothetical protein